MNSLMRIEKSLIYLCVNRHDTTRIMEIDLIKDPFHPTLPSQQVN